MAASSLLPKNAESFADSNYWRQFFKKRGDKVFEWYGSYAEIGHYLEKYLKPNDRILQIGCGNSTLADDLYDNGFRKVISVDIVEDAIRRQTEKNAQIRPDLEFRVANVTEIRDDGPLSTSTYQSIIDKGTLDALLPPDFDREQASAVRRMFTEVDRVLVVGGRYLVVTLAQPEIVQLWIENFQNRAYILRVHQMSNGKNDSGSSDDWRLPVFLLVATKLRKREDAKSAMPQMYEFLEPGQNAVPRRVKTAEDLIEAVKGAQEYAIFCDKARSGDIGDELRIDLHSSNSSVGARYVIYLTSCIERKKKYAHSYAIFVVPQGREHEWLFSTPKGRRELCSQAAIRRLAVVCLGRDHEFPNLEAVKTELNEKVMDFAPSDVDRKSGGRVVPYLSLGDDLGRRTVVCRGESEFSGHFVVEDVSHGHGKDQTTTRRLVFLKSQNLVQSEARLRNQRYAKQSTDRLAPIDWSYLSCAHHRIMLASLAVSDQDKKSISVCLLGLGGGCLATFIWKYFPDVFVTAVELDPAIADTAHRYFEFPKSDDRSGDRRLNCVIGDGLDFIREAASESTNKTFDVVLLDVAGPAHVDGLSCPLPSFVDDDCLQRLFTILKPNGVLAFNLVTRDDEKRSRVETVIDRYFPLVLKQKVEDELNQVLFCFCEKREPEWIQKFELRLQSMCDRLRKSCGGFNELKTSGQLNVESLLDRLANL